MIDHNVDGPVLIVGLGNPGREYHQNRHNAGAMAVDRLARVLGVSFRRRVGLSLVTEARRNNRDITLAKPTLYMNESGRAVASLIRSSRVDLSSLLVICDDLDLPLGRIRLRPEGGSAGHRGLASIIEVLGTTSFARLRIGIGRPAGSMDPADFVLEDFLDDELTIVGDALDRAVMCVEEVLDDGVAAAMNAHNGPAQE
ncbi:MAG: aminoacyl-tRNA hydrolase [Anaerolineales bacterium]